MSHFLKDRPHLWHRNLMKLILTVGLLSILAVSEITAQTSHSITTEFAMSASTEADTTTPAQIKNSCKRTWIATLKPKCQRCIVSCHPETVAEDCIGSCSAICGELEFSPEVVFCCDGFWGDGCDQECPGGSGNPCNGHGKCSMKHGQCACEPGFEGTACELCTDVTKYGPNCSLECNCEDGECNNGIHGDGLCAGENPCQSPVPPCGNNSQCIHTGTGRHRCACHDGYAGDGTECAPINPCQNNSGGCDVTTDCIYTGPNKHKCQCKEGYEGDNPDTGCTIKDMCRPGICGPNAVCETREPLKYSCVCNEGYTWDGTLCEGNIIKETAMDLIKTQADYSTMHSMIMAAGLSELFSRPNTTVLITNNKAWDSPSLIEQYYLKNEEEGRRKLEVILKNHVFPGVIDVTDLISKRSRKSYANIDVKVHLSDEGQIRLDGDVSITKANVPVKTGLCHRVDKVLVPSYLIPLVNNVCHVEETQKVEGHCVKCYESWKKSCPLSTDTPTDGHINCDGWRPWESSWPDRQLPYKMPGRGRRLCGIFSCFPPDEFAPLCYRMCLRTAKRRTCCKGFYDHSCLPCPGGSSNPCSGNGKCSDGDRGTGVCSCNDKFTGATCNRCVDNTTFGPQCNESCTCQFGQCDSGPRGTGKCRSGTCQLGYSGENCDKEMVPCESDDLCHVNAKCFLGEDGIDSCHCLPGYENDGYRCSMIDFCAEGRNPCDQQATCSQQGLGASKCTCNIGWHGDGFSCMPNQPCDHHPDCHPSAVCQDLEPGQYRCVCKTGYRGNGLVCTLVDLCLELNGNCHPEAQCTFIKEGKRNCTCPEFMVGDGITCRQRTIAEEIMENPKLARLRRIMKIVNASNNILDVVNTSYTFFAPNGRSFVNKFKKHTTSLEYWSQEENALSFLKSHTIRHAFSTDDLMASDAVIQSYATLYDGYSLHIENIDQNLHIYSSHSRPAVIRRANISAVNGYIHIINQVLVPFIPDSQEPSFTTLLSSKPKYKLFYEALQETNVLETLSSLKEYTLFVFPNDLVRHMKRQITADFLKYHILPQRVSTNAMLDKTEKDTILGSRYRLSMKRLRRKIYVNGVKITRPDMWTDVGVIHEVPELLRSVNNRCDLTINETTVKTECCGGYFGPRCDGCPDGPDIPCLGNGVCDDGVSGSGKCKCNPGFSGELCEIF